MPVTVPNLSEHLSSAETTEQLSARFAYAAAMKSINNLLLLGDGESWSRQSVDLGGLPEMVRCFLQVAAGAADIPVTRLLGQSPSGLSATGESDTRNYYDMIAARQELDLRPQLERLDRLMLRSEGLDPDGLTFAFRPLWQLDAASAAAIALQKAQATQVYAELKLWPAAVTARLVEAQLVQDGTYPSAAAVFAEGAAVVDSVTDARPVADLSATAFAPWVNEPRDPDGRWTTGGGRSTEPEDPNTSSPPPGAQGPHAPDGTPIELASFKRRGRLHAIEALLKGVARLWRRWRPGELDEPEPIAPDAGPPAQQDPSSSPAGSKQGEIPNHPEANRPAETDPVSPDKAELGTQAPLGSPASASHPVEWLFGKAQQAKPLKTREEIAAHPLIEAFRALMEGDMEKLEVCKKELPPEVVKRLVPGVIGPGPHATPPIRLPFGQEVTKEMRVMVPDNGLPNRCHVCGALTLRPDGGILSLDHQPPQALNVLGDDYDLYRHCEYHYRSQGGIIKWLSDFMRLQGLKP